jgi:hypothetical protein
MIGKNVKTDFSASVSEPVIDPSSYIHPLAAVIGNVILGKNIMVSPTASVRGDEGQPIYVGDDSNVQVKNMPYMLAVEYRWPIKCKFMVRPWLWMIPLSE